MAGSDLATRINTSVGFLPQVMSPLVKSGWVTSERGPGGGYRLTPEAYQITLYDLIVLLEGGGETGRCVFRDAPCPGADTCPIHNVWLEAREGMVQGFKRIPAILDQGDRQ